MNARPSEGSLSAPANVRHPHHGPFGQEVIDALPPAALLGGAVGAIGVMVLGPVLRAVGGRWLWRAVPFAAMVAVGRELARRESPASVANDEAAAPRRRGRGTGGTRPRRGRPEAQT